MRAEWLREAAQFLRDHGEVLGNRSCNDKRWPEGWSRELREEFLRAFHAFNHSEPWELEEDLERLELGSEFAPPDGCWADFLSHELEKEAARAS